MMTYGARVRWLVDHLAEGNGRELARMAGLTNPGHVNTFLSRAAKKPSAKLDPDTIERFVSVLGVSREWLMNGDGSPMSGAPLRQLPRFEAGRWQRYAARYPAFGEHARDALAGGVPEATLDRAADSLGEHKGDGPTSDEARQAIVDAIRRVDPWRRMQMRDATEEDFEEGE